MAKPKRSLENGRKLEYHPEEDYYYCSVPFKDRRTFANGGGVHIKVKKGDTLSKIAKQYTGNAMRYNELVKLNNITNPDLIEVGQDLFIPQEFIDTIKNNELSEVVVTGHKRQKKIYA